MNCPASLLPIFERPVSPAAVEQAVMTAFGIENRNALLRYGHSREIAWPRQVCAYLLREMAHLDYMQIGARLNQHSSTIHNSVKVVKDTISVYPKLEKAIGAIQDQAKAIYQKEQPNGQPT